MSNAPLETKESNGVWCGVNEEEKEMHESFGKRGGYKPPLTERGQRIRKDHPFNCLVTLVVLPVNRQRRRGT